MRTICNDDGFVVCRYCRFADGSYGISVVCTVGDNQGPVEPDEAECEYGEPCNMNEEFERSRWGLE